MAQFQLGSISTGTLRTEDLRHAFANTLEALEVGMPPTPAGEPRWLNLVEEARDDKFYADQDDQSVIDDLSDALNKFCPPFVYFGTLEGDGADFGFWVEQNAIDDFVSEAIEADLITVTNTGDEYANGTYIVHLAHDTENVTVMDMERNAIWSAA
jgi:hypothetical protein